MDDKQRLRHIQSELTAMTAAFCARQADGEYARLCQKLIEKMARKRVVPFLTGRTEIWAASIVYALGSINFLFDNSFPPYASPDSICEHFGVSKRTVAQKAKAIRDMFKLGHYDPEFSTEHMKQNNPFARLAMVNGFLIIREP